MLYSFYKLSWKSFAVFSYLLSLDAIDASITGSVAAEKEMRKDDPTATTESEEDF